MAAALLTGFEASGEDEAGLSRFYGIVYESDDTRAVGEPVPGAEITTEQDYNLTGHYVNSTVSGEDGSFEMFLPGGDFKVTVMKDGYEPFSTSLKVVPGRDVNMDIFLVKKPSGAGVNLSSEKVSAELLQGESLMIHLEVMNTGTGTDTIIVEISGKMREWASLGEPVITRSSGGGGPYAQSISNIDDYSIGNVDVNISVPDDAQAGKYNFTIRATSQKDPETFDTMDIYITVKEKENEEEVGFVIPSVGIGAFVLSLSIMGFVFLRRRAL